MKQIPNAITILRMLLTVALCFLLARPVAFIVVYLLCGATDVLDGWLARRLRVVSPLGAKLDSAADLLFFGASMVALAYLLRRTSAGYVGVLLGIVVAVRAANLIITRRRFAQWGILHTLGNKLAGLLLFLSIPVCIWRGGFPAWVTIPLFAVALLSSVDELLVLLTRDVYDPDAKGLLFRQTPR